MTIDYSKWDPTGAPQSDAPATAEAATSSTPGSIQAVIVRCDVERRRFMPWSATMIPADHPVFLNLVPPVPGLIEIPLVIDPVGTPSTNPADLDNQIATYLNIDSESGFAPLEWRSGVGTVVVARKDEKPLLPHHLEGVWMYCDYILDIFGEGEGAPTHLYNRQAFEKWCGGNAIVRNRRGSGRGPEAKMIQMIGGR